MDICPLEMLRAIEVGVCRIMPIPSLLKTYAHILITRICHYLTLYGTKDVANVIKFLKMLRLAWVQVRHMNL